MKERGWCSVRYLGSCHMGRGSTPPCFRSLGVCIKAFYSFWGLKAGESDRGEAAHSVFFLCVLLVVLVWVCFTSIFLCLGPWLATLFWLYLLCWQALEPCLDGLYRRSCAEYGVV
jgi:hypothetical protein